MLFPVCLIASWRTDRKWICLETLLSLYLFIHFLTICCTSSPFITIHITCFCLYHLMSVKSNTNVWICLQCNMGSWHIHGLNWLSVNRGDCNYPPRLIKLTFWLWLVYGLLTKQTPSPSWPLPQSGCWLMMVLVGLYVRELFSQGFLTNILQIFMLDIFFVYSIIKLILNLNNLDSMMISLLAQLQFRRLNYH